MTLMPIPITTALIRQRFKVSSGMVSARMATNAVINTISREISVMERS